MPKGGMRFLDAICSSTLALEIRLNAFVVTDFATVKLHISLGTPPSNEWNMETKLVVPRRHERDDVTSGTEDVGLKIRRRGAHTEEVC